MLADTGVSLVLAEPGVDLPPVAGVRVITLNSDPEQETEPGTEPDPEAALPGDLAS